MVEIIDVAVVTEINYLKQNISAIKETYHLADQIILKGKKLFFIPWLTKSKSYKQITIRMSTHFWRVPIGIMSHITIRVDYIYFSRILHYRTDFDVRVENNKYNWNLICQWKDINNDTTP